MMPTILSVKKSCSDIQLKYIFVSNLGSNNDLHEVDMKLLSDCVDPDQTPPKGPRREKKLRF